MTFEEFQTDLFEKVNFPFEFSEVMDIESNCGSTWITLQEGSTFFITIEKCEDSQDKKLMPADETGINLKSIKNES